MELLRDLTALQLVLLGAAGVLVGFNKVGLFGSAMIAVTIMASLFGGQSSVGMILPMLIAADVVAVIYYRRHADFSIVLRLLPWTLIGIGIGVLVGRQIPDEMFKRLIASILLISITILVIREFSKKEFNIPQTWWTAAILGIAAGFATMVGNAAGPIMTLYLLSMGLNKNQFIGTGAWFYLIVNIIKVPLHVFFWGTITFQTLTVDALAVPVIVGGALAGLVLVKLFKERPYRIFIFAVTAITSIRLFF